MGRALQDLAWVGAAAAAGLVGWRLAAPVFGRGAARPIEGRSSTATPSAHRATGGALLEAVKSGRAEEPTWIDVRWPDAGITLSVGAQCLRARVEGRLVRLPASYRDTAEICALRGWVPPTAELSDLIWRAATVRLDPQPLQPGKRPGGATDWATIGSLEWAIRHSEAVDRQVGDRENELAADQGKDWILSARNRHRVNGQPAATTYGWRDRSGKAIQGLGPDQKAPAHDWNHWDYSQTLRPIRREARRALDGAAVDLVELFVTRGLPREVTTPLLKANT